MADLYPLLMSPVFDPRPWGTTDLSPIYPNHRFDEKIGESWLTGDHCKVANGHLRGQSLAELSAQFGKQLVAALATRVTSATARTTTGAVRRRGRRGRGIASKPGRRHQQERSIHEVYLQKV